MTQTILSQNKNSLLAYAISKLSPEVFSHPVWQHFGKKEASSCVNLISNLLSVAKGLQQEHLSSACQILLICAVYQSYVGQQHNALKTVQQVVSLTEHSNLIKEMIWAIWGMCAILIQQRDYEQAAIYFGRLQDVLNKQNEWMLADFIDVLKQSLSQLGTAEARKYSESIPDPPSEDLVALAFRWLQQWGFSIPTLQAELGTISRYSTNQRWQNRWRDFLSTIPTRWRLRRTESDSILNKSDSSIWRFLSISINKSPANGRTDAQFRMNEVQVTNAPASAFPKANPVMIDEKGNPNHLDKQITPCIPLSVYMLGAFSLMIGDSPIKLSISRGLSVFKYLLLHHKQSTLREVLMDIFWPDSSLEAARNKLNVAMHRLRQTLRSLSNVEVICFENGAYGFASNLQISLDVEKFEHCVNEGQQLETQNQLGAAVTEYETAVNLYQGDFLTDTLYESWTVLDRERLRIAYLDTLARLSQIYFSQERYTACVTLCQLILSRDRCREDAHYRLMQCYSRLGQVPLALRQYQICAEELQAELEVDPAPETRRLYEQIHRHRQI